METLITHVVNAGTTELIFFPQKFFVNVNSILITNLSAATNAEYAINGQIPSLYLLPTEYRSLQGIDIFKISITAPADGAVQIIAAGDPVA